MTRRSRPGGGDVTAGWGTREFEVGLGRWVEAAVGPVRLEQVRVRPWSTLWRAHAEGGSYYAKQGAPANRFEAGLTAALAERLPRSFLPVTAVDLEHGLLLTPDQGAPYGHDRTDAEVWEQLVRGWAVVQRSVAGEVGELAALGVPLLLPGQAVGLARSRTDLLASLPAGDPRRLEEDERDRARAALPALAEDVAVLDDLGLPVTLDHDDLHGGNVFVRPSSSAAPEVRFFDLGDALVTEPMTALHVPLAAYADALGAPTSDPRVQRLVEAWVEVWDDVVPASRLRAALPAALRLARLCRHEVWWRVLGPLAEDEIGRHGGQAAAWLAALGDPVAPVAGCASAQPDW